jgi:ABC-2 type transport system permease protein
MSHARIWEPLHAEWTKLRTGRAGWLLLAAIVLTVAVSTGVTIVTKCASAACQEDPTRVSLTGIEVGQVSVAILAVLVISDEYSTGMIRTTLTAIPCRSTVLAAKAAVVSGVALVTGTIAVLCSLLVGRLILPGNGFTAAHGFAPVSLASGPTLRAAVGSVLYLILIALLSLGVASALRDSATSIGVVLGLLYLFPIFSSAVTDPHLQRHLQQIGPMTAGLAIEATTNLSMLPISPWGGIGVLTAWVAAGLLVGGLLLRLRDA